MAISSAATSIFGRLHNVGRLNRPGSLGKPKDSTLSVSALMSGAESNHRYADFQPYIGHNNWLQINHLQRLPSPKPAYPWHIPGTPKFNAAHSWHTRVRIAEMPSALGPCPAHFFSTPGLRERARSFPLVHLPLVAPSDALYPELPQRLGFDSARSSIVITEANEFAWPGPDLRPLPGRDDSTVVHGTLPPKFFAHVRDRFLGRIADAKAQMVKRTD